MYHIHKRLHSSGNKMSIVPLLKVRTVNVDKCLVNTFHQIFFSVKLVVCDMSICLLGGSTFWL